MTKLCQSFEIGLVSYGPSIKLIGCTIKMTEDSIKISMYDYLKRVEPIQLSRSRRKESDQNVTDEEMKAYRSLAGILCTWKCSPTTGGICNIIDATEARKFASEGPG